MRPTLVRLATAAAEQAGNSLRPRPMALLPPIFLYRRILRAHRKHLPADMRVLGDEYVKAEFRAHRKVDNPAHLIGFLSEWQLYAQKIEGDSWKGQKIDETKLAKMSDEQIQQLYELLQAIQKHKGVPGDEEPQS
uniref:Succinate dehydrogenase assembly factor 3 n=1 Tax=Bionectria ochroleuca TaxID=29856 RepID=A0A8H7NCE8_BIOOC